MKLWRASLVAIMALVVALSGCGGGGGPTADQPRLVSIYGVTSVTTSGHFGAGVSGTLTNALDRSPDRSHWVRVAVAPPHPNSSQLYFFCHNLIQLFWYRGVVIQVARTRGGNIPTVATSAPARLPCG